MNCRVGCLGTFEVAVPRGLFDFLTKIRLRSLSIKGIPHHPVSSMHHEGEGDGSALLVLSYSDVQAEVRLRKSCHSLQA